MTVGQRVVAIAVATLVLVGLVVLYVAFFLAAKPPAVSAAKTPTSVSLTLQTVATYGHEPHPDWVSYLAQRPDGSWSHSTIFTVPAHSLVTVTIYQYDTATGLRNPFFAQVRGVMNATLDGKPFVGIDQGATSHTFTVPDLGITVPLGGISDNAKNPCSVAPCSLSEDHTTIRFSFRTGSPKVVRWQCFVPCAAGFLFGNGGPMQTVGWMGGYIRIV